MIRLRAYHVITITGIVISLQLIINYIWSSHQTTPGINSYPGENLVKQGTNPFTLFIVILSARENIDKRNAIRKTWLLPLQKIKNVKHKFVIGSSNDGYLDQQLEQEDGAYQDLLLLPNLADDYGTLTGKVVESFKWVNKNIRTDFLLKCDDDSFVQLTKLLGVIREEEIPKTRLYWGFFRGRSSVKRTGKWAEKEWNLCDKYLPFAFGGGYILSSDLVHYIAANADFLKQFKNEDVTIGAWLSVLDITKNHDTRFNTEAESRGCSNNYLVSHKESADNMKIKYESWLDTGRMCPKEFNSYPGYIYNWNVLPSHCCHRLDGIE